MTKKILTILSCMSLLFCIPIKAQDVDYSDEDYWYSTCSKAQTTQEGMNACLGFQNYLDEQFEQLKKEMESYKDDLDSLQSNSSRIEELVEKQKKLSDALDKQVQSMEAQIEAVEQEIQSIQEEIETKQKEIDKWEDQIEQRMIQEQANTGTNILIDLIMGASSLNDMFRRFNGIERITASDQDQIEQLGELKKELELQKQEQERLSEQMEEQKQRIEEEKTYVVQLQDSYDQLAEQYHKVEADLRQKMQEEAERANNIPSYGVISPSDDVTIEKVSGFISPISGGGKSAGTWAYPGGGLHLGLDWAVSIGTAVVAPASGIIIYASNPAPTNGGYLGNWAGWPYGGGNTIEMLCDVNGTLYAISFAHLAQEGFAVSAGQTVSQGQVIALTGNSGNSSGPHCHIEVINLGNMSVSEAIARFSQTADFAFGTGWNSTATACEAGKAAPCRERPEKFF
ncbi:murein hydrolase activator EnvC family protein [Floccifex sp.]|uniref:murein hydrolase activator EnvC family protein n=1 Tax=Floccifex sp. TaxID=2815810 RepID=UPI003F027171